MPKKIIFKLGTSTSDIRRVFENPRRARPDTLTIYVKDWKHVIDALSPQKIYLLQQLLDYLGKPADVGTLAARVNRKHNAVSRDLRALEKQGLITKIKKGKNVYPQFTAKEIVIQLA